MKKLAIIGGGRMAEIYAIHAKKMGIESHCFSLEEGIVNKKAFDYLHYIDILNKPKVLKECKKISINGVVATTELTMETAAYVAKYMNLNGIPLSTAEKIIDKYHNRILTQNIKGLSSPKFSEVSNIDEINQLNFKYPIILKPIARGGKQGVVVVKEKKQLEEAFKYALKGAKGELPILVEEFIDGGIECSVESLSYNGKNYIIQVTRKVTSGAPHCVELAHHQPANVSKEIRFKIETIVDKILSVLNIKFGPCHTEIKIKNGEIYLIECNARPGGDHISYPLTELSTGYSFISGAIEIAINEFNGINKNTFNNKYSGVLFVTKQTQELLPLFEECEQYDWLYKKNKISKDLQTIDHNDGFNINYFIYCDNKIPNEIKEVYKDV